MMIKWIALTEDQLKLVVLQMRANEECLVDILQYPQNLSPEEKREYHSELVLTHDVMDKLESA